MKRVIILILVVFSLSNLLFGKTLTMVIMSSKDPKKEGPKYEVLADYLKNSIPEISNIKLRIAKDYPDAVKLFQSGEVDGMFSGSFVASIFIKKGLAVPLVRPVLKNGISTYKAIIITQKGNEYNGIDDLAGKKVAYCKFASSGEIFGRALTNGHDPETIFSPVIVKSHGIGINAVSSGQADFAIIKNLVFDNNSPDNIIVVGGDSSENPNMTLIVTNEISKSFGEQILKTLLKIEYDNTEIANNVKKAFNIKGFTKTSEADFAHTFNNLKKAKIDPVSFNFKF